MIGFIVGILVGGAVGFMAAAFAQAASEEDDMMVSELNMFDDEEIHKNCTVQVWKNSQTGETSVGWWQD